MYISTPVTHNLILSQTALITEIVHSSANGPLAGKSGKVEIPIFIVWIYTFLQYG